MLTASSSGTGERVDQLRDDIISGRIPFDPLSRDILRRSADVDSGWGGGIPGAEHKKKKNHVRALAVSRGSSPVVRQSEEEVRAKYRTLKRQHGTLDAMVREVRAENEKLKRAKKTADFELEKERQRTADLSAEVSSLENMVAIKTQALYSVHTEMLASRETAEKRSADQTKLFRQSLLSVVLSAAEADDSPPVTAGQ